MSMMKKLVAEFIGTAWLVFGGCGSAVFAAAFITGPPGNLHLGIGFTGVAIAFGLTLLTMVYTIGPISGCHINPALASKGGDSPNSILVHAESHQVGDLFPILATRPEHLILHCCPGHFNIPD